MDIGFQIILEQIEAMITDLFERLPSLAMGLVILLLFYYVGQILKRLVVRFFRDHRQSESLGRLLGRLSRWLLISFGLLAATLIVFPSFSFGQFAQLLGLGSLAAGIAFRNTFEDFFAGVLLLLNEPFQVNDQIVVDEYEGTVKAIKARRTLIETYDRRQIIIPNGDLLKNPVIVKTAYDRRRIQYDIGIGYGDDIDRARCLIVEAIESTDGILQAPSPEAIVVDLGDSAVIVRARWWIEPPRRSNATHSRARVLQAIKTRLWENGIDLPFPTRQVLFHDQTEESDGDRRRQREGWPAGSDDIPRPQRIVDMVAQLTKSKGHDNKESSTHVS